MSDFSLSSEDIVLLINGKFPLITSQNRLSHAACQVFYNLFILAIHRGSPKQTPCSLVTFSSRFTHFPFQQIKKPCFFRGANNKIYPPRKNAN